MLQPTAIADACWFMAHQIASAWTHELDVRPFEEKFYRDPRLHLEAKPATSLNGVCNESLWNDRLRFPLIVDYAADRIKSRIVELDTKEPVDEELRYVGLDVHVESITVAVADEKDEPRSLGPIPNTLRPRANWLRGWDLARPCESATRLASAASCCISCNEMGVTCAVIAPSLILQRSGERVKTDRLDGLRLARYNRAGELMAILVPSKEQEGLRGLLRALHGSKRDQIHHMHQLAKFLLRPGQRKPPGMDCSVRNIWHGREPRTSTMSRSGRCSIITCSSWSTAPKGSRNSPTRSTMSASSCPKRLRP
jgi:hypothetical protein